MNAGRPGVGLATEYREAPARPERISEAKHRLTGLLHAGAVSLQATDCRVEGMKPRGSVRRNRPTACAARLREPAVSGPMFSAAWLTPPLTQPPRPVIRSRLP